MRVVVAVDKFKGSLTAEAAATALESGILQAAPDASVVRVPIADGGDGTLAAAVAAGYERVPVVAEGPTGERVNTAFARRGDTAVVELADVSGLARLSNGLRPLHASTVGTGQVMAAAVDAGCKIVILGVGGSSSTDGGLGLVVGLGARVLNAEGRPVAPGRGALRSAASMDLGPLRTRMDGVRVVLASDVDNGLLGSRGAAAVYGPQKGATPPQVDELEEGLRSWSRLVAQATGRDESKTAGAGAAGGAGFAALAILQAEPRSGAEVVLGLVDFANVAAGSDLIITGEGSLDDQTLRGKAPLGVLRSGLALGVPVDVVCGRTTLSPQVLSDVGFRRVWALVDRQPDVKRAIEDAGLLLHEVGTDVVNVARLSVPLSAEADGLP